MALPRVFISSTYYDLKYVRSSLDQFIASLGFEPVLSEKGSVAYTHDQALDESCYREVQGSDIYVLIIGGRYGSEASSNKGKEREISGKYESVTKMEYRAAVERDLPIYILIEKSVYAEYMTFLRNRDSVNVKYAHVDDVNVFRFIEEILVQPRNNPFYQFDRYSEIESWLRLQWAGVFRELLQRKSSQQQLSSLAEQVQGLAEVNKTMRKYLEEVVEKISPKASVLINSESARLEEASLVRELRQIGFIRFAEKYNIPIDMLRLSLEKSASLSDFIGALAALTKNSDTQADARLANILPALRNQSTFEDINRARELLGRPRFQLAELIELRNREKFP